MWHDQAAVEFLQPNLAERQDYTGTVGTEREQAKKTYFILKMFHKDNFNFTIPHCQLLIISASLKLLNNMKLYHSIETPLNVNR